jgi:hypothetical protein
VCRAVSRPAWRGDMLLSARMASTVAAADRSVRSDPISPSKQSTPAPAANLRPPRAPRASVRSTGKAWRAYRVAGAVASIFMGLWELLSFFEFERWYASERTGHPIPYVLVLVTSNGSIITGLVLVPRRTRGAVLQATVMAFALVAIVLLLGVGRQWQGFFYFLESAYVITPVALIAGIGLRHSKPRSPTAISRHLRMRFGTAACRRTQR